MYSGINRMLWHGGAGSSGPPEEAISGLVFYHDAQFDDLVTTAGGSVSAILDKEQTTSYDLSQGTSGNRPTHDQDGDYFLFDGINDFLNLDTTVNLGTTHTLFVKFRKATTGTLAIFGGTSSQSRVFVSGNLVYYRATTANSAIPTVTHSADQDHVLVMVREDRDVHFYLDGSFVITDDLSANGTDSFIITGIGRRSQGSFFNGRLYKWGGYNRALSPSEVATII